MRSQRLGLIILQTPPLSFGHFPRERGNPDSFAKVSKTWNSILKQLGLR